MVVAAFKPITSSYTRKVTTTVGIEGSLPNTLFTLTISTIHVVFCHDAVNNSAKDAFPALCSKFFLSRREFNACKRVFRNNTPYCVVLDCGRVYAQPIPAQDYVPGERFTLIRTPPVLNLLDDGHFWHALTAWGCYTWNISKSGHSGLRYSRPRPTFVDLQRPLEIIDAYCLRDRPAYRTAAGWFTTGINRMGYRGLGRVVITNTLTLIANSAAVFSWYVGVYVTVGFTATNILICGCNSQGQCGVGFEKINIMTLTPVALPNNIKGKVDRVVDTCEQTFFFSGARCFGCGSQQRGALGVGPSHGEYVKTPVELPLPVDHLTCWLASTLISSRGAVYVCGDNSRGQIDSTGRPVINTLTQVIPPDPNTPIRSLSLTKRCIIVRLTDGTWYARGDLTDDVCRSRVLGAASLGWSRVSPVTFRKCQGVVMVVQTSESNLLQNLYRVENQRGFSKRHQLGKWSATEMQ